MPWELKKENSNPIWNEYVEVDRSGAKTGRTSLSENIRPQKISTFDKCKHSFRYADNGNSAVCSKCGIGQKIVLGIHKIESGKLIQVIK